MKTLFDRDVEMVGRMAAAFMALELAAKGWPAGWADRAVAKRFGVSSATAAKWRRAAIYRDAPEIWRDVFCPTGTKAG